MVEFITEFGPGAFCFRMLLLIDSIYLIDLGLFTLSFSSYIFFADCFSSFASFYLGYEICDLLDQSGVRKLKIFILLIILSIFSLFFIFYFLRWCLTLSLRLECVAQSQLTATSVSWVQVIFLPQPPEQLGLEGCTIMPC